MTHRRRQRLPPGVRGTEDFCLVTTSETTAQGIRTPFNFVPRSLYSSGNKTNVKFTSNNTQAVREPCSRVSGMEGSSGLRPHAHTANDEFCGIQTRR
ncbi:hypothetical protein GN956_G26177 [Arapaima gigas]